MKIFSLNDEVNEALTSIQIEGIKACFSSFMMLITR
jgi:hypothetical protein